MTKPNTTDELRRLPAAERLKIIEELWDSLDEDLDQRPTPDWHRTEIDRRLDALDSGVSVGASWEDVQRRITGKP